MGNSSLKKALRILLAFDENNAEMSISEISKLLGIPISTAHRLAQDLKEMGFLDQDNQTRKYRLGTVFLKLANTMKSNLSLIKTAYPYMKELARYTMETTHLNIRDGYERVCVETIESTQPLMARMTVGSRSPLYAGASSKCLLAFSSDEFIKEYLSKVELKPVTPNTITDKEKLMEEIERIRRTGYAVSLSERNLGLGALSAPIFDHDRNLVASLSLAIPEIRFRDEKLRKGYIEKLLAITSKISAAFGHG